MTTKLYFDNPMQMKFQATVLSCIPTDDNQYDIVLDQTCFYPTGGGQSCDKGKLGDYPVLDVRKEGDTVIHTIAQALEAGTTVSGDIDESYRIGNMQAHTGQHILSASFLAELNAETLAVKMSADGLSTVDVSIGDLSVGALNSVEALANKVIMENRPAHSTFVPPDSPRLNDLRRAVKFDKVADDVRLVEIEDFDLSACAGTHLPSTGMLGILKIISAVNYKGGSRVSFAVGWEVLGQFRLYQNAVDQLNSLLSSGIEDIPERVSQLLLERNALSKEVDSLRESLLAYEADSLFVEGQVITQAFDDRSADELRTLASILTQKGTPLVAFASLTDGDTTLLIATNGDNDYHAGNILKATLAEFDGRGGGRDGYAQGILKNFTDTDILLASINTNI
ncbi:MAG: DHHA1 domain-containing protein [Chloroflexota bacterium]